MSEEAVGTWSRSAPGCCCSRRTRSRRPSVPMVAFSRSLRSRIRICRRMSCSATSAALAPRMRPPQGAVTERDVMSDVDAVEYSYGDLDRRGRLFGLHLPQFVIGWVVIFSLIPMLHAHSVATVAWWALLDIVLVYVAFGRGFDRGLWAGGPGL